MGACCDRSLVFWPTRNSRVPPHRHQPLLAAASRGPRGRDRRARPGPATRRGGPAHRHQMRLKRRQQAAVLKLPLRQRPCRTRSWTGPTTAPTTRGSMPASTQQDLEQAADPPGSRRRPARHHVDVVPRLDIKAVEAMVTRRLMPKCPRSRQHRRAACRHGKRSNIDLSITSTSRWRPPRGAPRTVEHGHAPRGDLEVPRDGVAWPISRPTTRASSPTTRSSSRYMPSIRTVREHGVAGILGHRAYDDSLPR